VLGVTLAAVVVGLIFLFVIPWVGFVIGAIGLILLLVYVIGAVRRPVTREEKPS
jgi:membrane protein implicated in regulation of membrane protease activity